MPDYILDWDNGRGYVQGSVPVIPTLFTTDEKPALNFDYAILRYETATGLCFKMMDGNPETIPLSKKEVAACRAFCDAFADTADYPVQTYEAETGLFRGTMLKSEAEKQKLAWLLGNAPDHPVSKLMDGKWERVVALFMEDGHYRLLPDATCPKCIVFLSQAEWDAWPKPQRSTEVWDFATEKWRDYRTLEQAKTTADEYIRSAYTSKRAAAMGQVPAQEMATWPWQLAEAQAWTADPATPTPFLDAMLGTQAATLSADEEAIVAAEDKAALVANILKHDDPEYLAAVGAVHGEMRGWILRVWNAETLAEVDALTAAVAEALSISPLIRPLSGF